jgi:hypothetical protein
MSEDLELSYEEQELLEILSDPVKFAQHHFGWEAYPYQAEALRDMYYRKVLRWGRRTGKSDMLAVFVLWYAFTHGEDPDDPRVRPAVCLVATPYESQVKLIFKRIRELISKSPEIQQSIAVNRKNPEYIEFKNKATIAGFTAGTKSGAGAGNMRGQYADWIIVDEMDYMTDDDVTAIFAIASDKNRPDYLPPIGLMISSTPNGRRGKFYEFCFLPGTRIATPEGLKNIEDFKVGDKLYGIFGNIETVSHCFVRQTTEDILELKLHHLYTSIKGTPNHPIKTLSGWKELGKLTCNDYVLIPHSKFFDTTRPSVDIDLSGKEQFRYNIATEDGKIADIAKKYGVDRGTVSSIKKNFGLYGKLGLLDKRKRDNINKAQYIIDNIPVTKELLELAGYYLAEGSIYQYHKYKYISGFNITFAGHELEKALRCKQLIKELFDKNAVIEDRRHINNVYNVKVNNGVLGIVFKTLFGERENKHIPSFMLGDKDELVLFNALVSGDGYTREDGSIVINLTAKRVIEQVYDMLIRNGKAYSISYSASEGKRDFLTLYELKDNKHYKWHNGELYLNVKSITKVLDGRNIHTVYNLETDATHTYVAEFMAVHNCMNAQDNVLEVPPGKYHGTHKDAIWTEYYYPSLANPGWQKLTDEEREQEIRQWKLTLGEVGYVHEILAEFGIETVGVFNKNYIDRAKRDYKYSQTAVEGPVRVIGVDWDKVQATPTLCCLEWCPDEENDSGQKGMFKVINRISVPKEEFTLDAGVRQVVEWNKIYQPEWIYVDRGFGDYQVEMLHKMGKLAGSDPTNPAYLLHKRVKGIHFGEYREIRDPGTGEIVKKPIKPWMVTQTVILFERDRIIINKNDDELWKQLENYRVEKVSTDGRPTYTSVNEHSVDALMLCALAIAEQLPDHIKFVQKFEPTRKMLVAPPIVAPSMPIARGPRDINIDDEYAKANKMRGKSQYAIKGEHPKDYQTWFRVDDIRDTAKNRNLDQTTISMFMKSPFVPRGTKRKHSSRGTF